MAREYLRSLTEPKEEMSNKTNVRQKYNDHYLTGDGVNINDKLQGLML